uniref:Uncharacterized protein n=1 Tax=Onchocerca volvulus TaxID=6282 RepID=A0A8R1XPU5_ONCVO
MQKKVSVLLSLLKKDKEEIVHLTNLSNKHAQKVLFFKRSETTLSHLPKSRVLQIT